MYVEIGGYFCDRPPSCPPFSRFSCCCSLVMAARSKHSTLSWGIVSAEAITIKQHEQHRTSLKSLRTDTRTCSCTPSTLLRPTAPRSPAGRPTPRLCSTRSSLCSRSPRRSPFLPPRPTPLFTPMLLPTPTMSTTSTSLLPTGPARSSQSSTLPLGCP
jgi:hypothetical protein